MIIDIILERKEGEEAGEEYDARAFYDDISEWVGLSPVFAVDISSAMDCGTNEDIQAALCRYIDAGRYNPELKDWINSREWVKD